MKYSDFKCNYKNLIKHFTNGITIVKNATRVKERSDDENFEQSWCSKSFSRKIRILSLETNLDGSNINSVNLSTQVQC